VLGFSTFDLFTLLDVSTFDLLTW